MNNETELDFLDQQLQRIMNAGGFSFMPPQWPGVVRDSMRAALGAAIDAGQDTAGAAFDMRAHLARQIEFSARTFGPGKRTNGVIDHICKELDEIMQEPDDLSEWIDVVILALDGAWRCGGTPDTIIAALQAKQAKNEARVWPDWRGADPDKAIEHDRAADQAVQS